jgi:hypothetical protein
MCSKGKGHRLTCYCKHRGSSEGKLYPFIITIIRGCGWSTPRSGRFSPGKEMRYPLHNRLYRAHSRQPWLVRIMSSQPGFKPRTLQPVASHCTSYATCVQIFRSVCVYIVRAACLIYLLNTSVSILK